jgi:hypothetical protein
LGDDFDQASLHVQFLDFHGLESLVVAHFAVGTQILKDLFDLFELMWLAGQIVKTVKR